MRPKTPKLLEDIRAAAAFILDKTRGNTLEQYQVVLVQPELESKVTRLTYTPPSDVCVL